MSHTPGGFRPLCPGCGTKGESVGATTVRALLASYIERTVPGPHGFWFCTSRLCNVAYFSCKGWSADKSAITVRIGCKENVAPIPVCYCFDYTRQDILKDLRQRGVSTIRERVQSAMEADECRCTTRNPTGKCCLSEIESILDDAAGGGPSDPSVESSASVNNRTRIAS